MREVEFTGGRTLDGRPPPVLAGLADQLGISLAEVRQLAEDNAGRYEDNKLSELIRRQRALVRKRSELTTRGSMHERELTESAVKDFFAAYPAEAVTEGTTPQDPATQLRDYERGYARKMGAESRRIGDGYQVSSVPTPVGWHCGECGAYDARARAKYSSAQLKAMLGRGQALANSSGDPSFPIMDREDLSNAIRAVGRAGSSHDKVRAYIIRRARALGLSSLIPASWTASEATG